LLVRIVEWRYRVYNHQIGRGVGKIVGLWEEWAW
jgi:hypothetical protein